uniref:Peroxisomal biogenesis factor 3 n=1 Tax=Corethrella appendiculata TaxID=1370023 RepID=U5EXC5_9DIPT
MFSRIRGFLNRHRRKFIVTGIVVGGGVLLLRYAQRKFREFQEAQAKELAEKFKRIQHLESTERTCNQTITGLTPSMGGKILKDLETKAILDKLRSNPDNKMELWDELKIIAFTRVVAIVYASIMLVITLRIQLSILGGHIYKDILVSDDNEITTDVQTLYMSLIQHLMGPGLNDLIEIIKKHVTEILSRYKLKQKLTLADTETLFWTIQMAVINDEQNPVKFLPKYVFPAEIDDASNGILTKMYAETLDVLESDETRDLFMQNLSNGFSLVVDKIAEFYSESKPPSTSHDAEPSTSNGFIHNSVDSKIVNINNIEVPLAKLIPIINGLTTKCLNGYTAAAVASASNSADFNRNQDMLTSLISFLISNEKIKTLAANVYETFCQ